MCDSDNFRALYEITVKERNALSNAIEAIRELEPAMVIPLHVDDWEPAEAFFEGTVHTAQAFREAIIQAIREALAPLERQ
jgi:hypothetical protein